MRGLRYILITLAILCCRGLSAQEFDLYDFRYYKRFDSVEELLAPEADTMATAKSLLNRHFSTNALKYNLSMVRFARRGRSRFEDRVKLNGVEIPRLGAGSIRALQLSTKESLDKRELYIDTLRKSQTSAGIAFSTRNMPYSLRLSTAQKLNGGWSIATNLNVQTGNDMHIEGLFGNSLEVNIVAAKRFSNNHSLSFAVFARPSMRSTRVASTAEAFRFTGNNLYNPSWGYQDGKVRNARIRREFTPTAYIGYEKAIGKRTKLNLSIAAIAGIERYSSLDWFNAQTPAPDNYRYMPSYFVDEDDIFSVVENAWLSNDTRYTQIDFDRLISTNKLNGKEAVYAISDRVNRIIESSLRFGVTTSLNMGKLSYGVEASTSNSRNYKQMRDMLGAEYIVDLDYFLVDDDTFGNSLQNNLNSPNRHIRQGDKFGYDYAVRQHYFSVFGSYHYSTPKVDVDIAAKVGYANISRRGFYRKELFADHSFGVSRQLQFSPYALRVSADYLIANNHFVRGVIVTETEPCDAENMFLQSQYNNRTVDSPAMRSTHSAELQYIFQQENITVSTTLFVYADLNDTHIRHLYDDISGEYADVVTSNCDYLRYGLETEARYRFASHFSVIAALSLGRYKYADNALVTIYSDKSNILLTECSESKTKGLSIGNAPQAVVTMGLSYAKRGWYANLNLNYAGLRYIEPSMTMRTERVLNMATSPEQRYSLLAQERLPDAFTIDISLSKSLYLNRLSKRVYSTNVAPRFGDKHPDNHLILRLGVRNLLGSSDIIYNAYETSRLQRHKLANEYIYNRQASHYLYAYPRTIYASVAFAF